jgi:Ca2+-binding RTX toxin-like protein
VFLGMLLVSLAVAGAAANPVAAAPTCAEGPQAIGDTIYGTPCDDTIHAPLAITTVFGEGGADGLYGGRSNDALYGGEGEDRLYGGIGDDRLRGGPGGDLLSGGFGADSLDGEAGSDYVRGDATIDAIGDSGPADEDTLSFATGATPGFPNEGGVIAYEGFPAAGGERGVYVDLTQGFANDGRAPDGGGVDGPLDAADFESFERILGTPFSDLIVGAPGAEKIYGGGGADVILGGGGADQVFGGADGDYCDVPGGTASSCEFSGATKKAVPRNPGAIAVGWVAPGSALPALYLAGGSGVDRVSATFAISPPRVSFELLAGSAGAFDTSAAAAGGCEPPAGGEVVCPVAEAPDSIVLAGLAGADSFTVAGFPPTTSIVELGGGGGDSLGGTGFEDVLIDGPGDDVVSAGAGDDAVPNNQGTDSLAAGAGDDLFISAGICEGDGLDGGEGRDNANWANFGVAVTIDMAAKLAGRAGPEGQLTCAGEGPPTQLEAIDDVEGTSLADALIGDAGSNQLLGRLGADTYKAGLGDDSILANSGDGDPLIDCGAGFDTVQIDHLEYGDAAPQNCESSYERDPNSFRPPDTPPDPDPDPIPPQPNPTDPTPPTGGASLLPVPQLSPAAPDDATPSADRIPPRTRVLRAPRGLILTDIGHRAQLAFAFTAGEPGAAFRCKLDRGAFSPCRSPRAYRVGVGEHSVCIVAIDGAGNRDRTPALVRFRVALR